MKPILKPILDALQVLVPINAKSLLRSGAMGIHDVLQLMGNTINGMVSFINLAKDWFETTADALVENETARNTAEAARAAAETIRSNNEDERSFNETERTNNESTRADNETLRQSAEAARVAAETARAAEETARASRLNNIEAAIVSIKKASCDISKDYIDVSEDYVEIHHISIDGSEDETIRIPLAVANTNAGLMSMEDKRRLDYLWQHKTN